MAQQTRVTDLSTLAVHIGLDAPREGADRLWSGLSPKLQDVPKWLGLGDCSENVISLGKDAAARRWVGQDYRITIAVSSKSSKHLRQSLLTHVVGLHSVPLTMYAKGSEDIGDTCFTIARKIVVFTRGNLGVVVHPDISDHRANQVAEQIDKAILQERTIDVAELPKYLPVISRLSSSTNDLDVGETVRIGIETDKNWKAVTRPLFLYDQDLLEAIQLEETSIELEAVKVGSVDVTGCLIDRRTALCRCVEVHLNLRGTASRDETEAEDESEEE